MGGQAIFILSLGITAAYLLLFNLKYTCNKTGLSPGSEPAFICRFKAFPLPRLSVAIVDNSRLQWILDWRYHDSQMLLLFSISGFRIIRLVGLAFVPCFSNIRQNLGFLPNSFLYVPWRLWCADANILRVMLNFSTISSSLR